jgi:hypothetical protein
LLNLAASRATHSMGLSFERSRMTALAKTIARAFPANSPQINIVQQLLLFALAGLFVSVLVASYGVDLSPGLF